MPAAPDAASAIAQPFLWLILRKIAVASLLLIGFEAEVMAIKTGQVIFSTTLVVERDRYCATVRMWHECQSTSGCGSAQSP